MRTGIGGFVAKAFVFASFFVVPLTFAKSVHAVLRCPPQNIYAPGDALCYETSSEELRFYIDYIPVFEVSDTYIDITGMGPDPTLFIAEGSTFKISDDNTDLLRVTDGLLDISGMSNTGAHTFRLWSNPDGPQWGPIEIQTTGVSDFDFRVPDGAGNPTSIMKIVSEPSDQWVFLSFPNSAIAVDKPGTGFTFVGATQRFLAMYDDTRHFAFDQDGTQNADLVLWSDMQFGSGTGELGVRSSGGESLQLYVPDGSGGTRNALEVSNGLLDMSGMSGDVVIKPKAGQQFRANDGVTELFNFAQGALPSPMVFFGSPAPSLGLYFVDSTATVNGGGITWDGNGQEWVFSGDTVGQFLKISDDGVVVTNKSSHPACEAGAIYFNTTDKHFYGCDGTTWKQLDN